MYEAFYGLKEKPFNLTPDPRFLFLSEKHKEAFAHLMYGIKSRGGFVMVTGEIGTGKTTICRTLLNRLDPDTEVAFIFNPCLSPEELLRTINEDFGIRSRAASIKGLIDELNYYLLDRRSQDKNCVLVIDEAQNLAPSVLEQIRLLSNLETEKEKLLQIVLIGQPELVENLHLPELRQLNQRITARYHLRELSSEETLQYIAYRLRVAGGRRKVRFTRRAIRTVYRQSGGVPRVINAICDRALLVGYTIESRDITGPIVRRAAREVRGDNVSRPRKRVWRRALKPLAAAAVLALVAAGLVFGAPSWVREAIQNPYQAQASTPTKPSQASAPPASPAAPSLAPAEAPAPAEADTRDYGALLEGLEPEAARNAGAEAILSRWNRTAESMPQSEGVPEMAEWLRQNGFDAEVITPGLHELLAIDLPAFALILGKELQPLWIGIVGKEDDRVEIAVGPGKTDWVPQRSLENRYTFQAIVPWLDPNPGGPVLSESTEGDRVRVLQEQLASVGRYKGASTGIYDFATATAVKMLQGETGLTKDGKVGRQTRMVLSSWTDLAPVTRLSESKRVIATPAPEPPATEPAPAVAAEAPPAPPAETAPVVTEPAAAPAEIPSALGPVAAPPVLDGAVAESLGDAWTYPGIIAGPRPGEGVLRVDDLQENNVEDGAVAPPGT